MGTDAAVAARLAAMAPVLARQLGLPLLPPLDPAVGPDRALAALAVGAAGPGLVPLPQDPGLLLAQGGTWAAALGAWRQPCLLLLEADQLSTGVVVSTVALLQQQAVPLLGLIQWGEPWQPELRRCDGLPWLGALTPGGEPEGVDLRAALALRLAAQGAEAA